MLPNNLLQYSFFRSLFEFKNVHKTRGTVFRQIAWSNLHSIVVDEFDVFDNQIFHPNKYRSNHLKICERLAISSTHDAGIYSFSVAV